MINEQLTTIYKLLYDCFGCQNWWPGETPFEVIVGAVLTQNTNWTNVEKAIANLKDAGLLSAEKLYATDINKLAGLIRPAGYYNVKAKRLHNFLKWLFDNYGGRLEGLETSSTQSLREELLDIKGIGQETADSILLYALNRAIFVVDAYTARIAIRHYLIEAEADYRQLQELFESNLPEDTRLFNEYHALLVRLGKEYCKPSPRCQDCPLNGLPHNTGEQYD